MAPELDVLTRIALHRAKTLARLKAQKPVEALRREPLYARAPRSLKAALAQPGLSVIAEVKFASPSNGVVRPPSAEAAVEIAGSYLSAGARALSILTERNFFAGDPEFLAAVRRAHPEACLLMKDFTLEPYQLELARACGADAVLLIVALLGERTKELLAHANALGLSCLVETHTDKELELAKATGAEIIGVNSRDLKTLKTDLDTARRLAGKGGGALLVAESGLRSREDLRGLKAAGYGAFLVGTSLMKEADPGAALARLLA